MNEQIFWMLAVIVAFIGPLVVGAFVVEELMPRARRRKRNRFVQRDTVAEHKRIITRRAFKTRAGIRE